MPEIWIARIFQTDSNHKDRLYALVHQAGLPFCMDISKLAAVPSLHAWYLVKQALEGHGLDLNQKMIRIEKDEKGRPNIVDLPDSCPSASSIADLSVSHSGAFVAVALCESRCGLDIQEFHVWNERTTKKICTEQEWKMVTKLSGQHKDMFLTGLFTMKEAWGKLNNVPLMAALKQDFSSFFALCRTDRKDQLNWTGTAVLSDPLRSAAMETVPMHTGSANAEWAGTPSAAASAGRPPGQGVRKFQIGRHGLLRLYVDRTETLLLTAGSESADGLAKDYDHACGNGQDWVLLREGIVEVSPGRKISIFQLIHSQGALCLMQEV